MIDDSLYGTHEFTSNIFKFMESYVGYGVLSYNLHVIGRELLARQRNRGDTFALAA